MMRTGLLAACLGSVLLALSSFRGVVSGFVGTTVWPTPGWRLANLMGWLLLIGGFLLQYVSVWRASRPARAVRTAEALLNVLERKGVITNAEVQDEIKRLPEER